jgi:hypothetical protein
MLTLVDFEYKIKKKIKTHKNSYTGWLWITDTQYGGHKQEIPLDFERKFEKN